MLDSELIWGMFILHTCQNTKKKNKWIYSFTSQVAQWDKNPLANAGDAGHSGSTPGSGRSPGGGPSNPPQYSCLENSMDRGTWWAPVHRVAKSWTWLNRLSTHTHQLLMNLSPLQPSRAPVALKPFSEQSNNSYCMSGASWALEMRNR